MIIKTTTQKKSQTEKPRWFLPKGDPINSPSRYCCYCCYCCSCLACLVWRASLYCLRCLFALLAFLAMLWLRCLLDLFGLPCLLARLLVGSIAYLLTCCSLACLLARLLARSLASYQKEHSKRAARKQHNSVLLCSALLCTVQGLHGFTLVLLNSPSGLGCPHAFLEQNIVFKFWMWFMLVNIE